MNTIYKVSLHITYYQNQKGPDPCFDTRIRQNDEAFYFIKSVKTKWNLQKNIKSITCFFTK